MKLPGSVLLAIGCGAGLATGLSRFPDQTLLIGASLGITWLLRAESWAPLLPAYALGVMVGAHTSHMARASCAAMLHEGERTYLVELIDPGEGTGRVSLTGAHCTGRIAVHWPEALHIPAGRTVRVTGRWLPSTRPFDQPDGMLLGRTADAPHGTPGTIDRMRTALARASILLYGPRAPMVDALVSGRRSQLDPDLKEAFAAAGLVHLLAVSGFHISLLGVWVLLALRLARVPRHAAEGIAAFTCLGYAAFLGWAPPATRAAILLLLAGILSLAAAECPP